MHRSIPKIAYLLVLVTALGFPLIFLAAWWIARSLDLEVSLLSLVIGTLLVTGLADFFLALANERFNERPDARLHQRNALVGDEAIVVDGFSLGETITSGRVKLKGQLWTAQCDDGEQLVSGQRVKVTDRQGLTLVVKPVTAK